MCGTFKMKSGGKMVWSKKKDLHQGAAELSRLKGTPDAGWRQTLFIQTQVCSNCKEQKYTGNMCLSQSANSQHKSFDEKL